MTLFGEIALSVNMNVNVNLNLLIVTKQHPQHARFGLANPNRLPDLSIRQEREWGTCSVTVP